jgi:hypothetical protein
MVSSVGLDGRAAPILFAAALAAASLLAREAGGYPLDGYPETGIKRVEAYRIAQKNKINGAVVRPGAELTSDQIQLSLLRHQGFRIPPPDPDLSAQLRDLLGRDAPAYGVAVLDITDPDRPRYAEHNGRMKMMPGSLGKVLVALGLFQTLADVHPKIDARKKVLRETVIVADDFIGKDTHEVPFWELGQYRVERRPIEEGDAFNLWTYLDHMISASSNAAAAMVQKHALLLRRYGKEYPVSEDRAYDYFDDTSSASLGRALDVVLHQPVARNGLDPSEIRQGGFFSRVGKQRVPGAGSYATARELVHMLMQMEKGQLVDPWSSVELKKLLYLTERRSRYAASPALTYAAVYFKSGSMFRCRPEAGFFCEKYHGNVWNYMNSVAIIETPDRPVPMRYLVAVLSNVLRRNSAEEHEAMATLIHQFMERQHPITAASAKAE